MREWKIEQRHLKGIKCKKLSLLNVQRKHPYLTDKNLVIFYLHSPTWGSYPGVNENKSKDQTMYRLYSYDILNKLRY